MVNYCKVYNEKKTCWTAIWEEKVVNRNSSFSFSLFKHQKVDILTKL